MRGGRSEREHYGWGCGGCGGGVRGLGFRAGVWCGCVEAWYHGAHHAHSLGRRRCRYRRRGRGGVLRHGCGRAHGRGRAGSAGVLEARARRRRRRRRSCSRCGLLLAKTPATGRASRELAREGCGAWASHIVSESLRSHARDRQSDVLACRPNGVGVVLPGRRPRQDGSAAEGYSRYAPGAQEVLQVVHNLRTAHINREQSVCGTSVNAGGGGSNGGCGLEGGCGSSGGGGGDREGGGEGGRGSASRVVGARA